MKIHKLTILALFISLAGASNSWAHPTSFQGAWSLMNESSSMSRHLMTTYSHRYWLASAAHYSRIELKEEGLTFEAASLGVNALLKRWNRPTSQGNFYVSVAQGREFTNGLKERNVTKTEIDLDWEDRRFYTATGYSRYFRHDRDIDVKKLRLGFAPYLGEFTELNTWFIVEAKQVNSETVDITPMLRFYYRNTLWEIGSSLRGSWMFNFMLHLF
jgi:hypothetical protein